MRLTHLKLAGFKSFVDPTTLHLHGQRVGVVGPNGCGKSNVMESVRWVLGESSAKEMRGDSMHDVIFNGSGNRKSISRASVELIFDNSLGGANGEWSQYAEISVKRIIERDKGSSYYINNTLVRRRDVADLFLGTGLGGRAYAIIGQNTISRIVEAKPEELRVFLEEAAGISKYKERRRETEFRLRDTRENLTRVEDIRQEMDKQIHRLESQAVVTEQYHGLHKRLKHIQGQLWLVKRREAANTWERLQRTTEKLINELEAQMANLRKTESQLEGLRQSHYSANEVLQSAQTRYYEVNAEVSSLESQVKHTQEARERLVSQLQQIKQQSQKNEMQLNDLNNSINGMQEKIGIAESEEVEILKLVSDARAALPTTEKTYQSATHIHAQTQREYSEIEQSIRLESNHLEFISKDILTTKQRFERLESELKNLDLPSEQELQEKKHKIENEKFKQAKYENDLKDLKAKQIEMADEIKKIRASIVLAERELSTVSAEISSLLKLQASIGHESKLDAWLQSQGFTSELKLWQSISIQAGWETALEAVLGNQLNACILASTSSNISTRPPAPVSLIELSSPTEYVGSNRHFEPILQYIKLSENGLSLALQELLGEVYLLPENVDAHQARQSLKPSEVLVNQKGDIFTKHSVYFHAPQSTLHGVLQRQKELEALQQKLPALQKVKDELHEQLQQAENQLSTFEATSSNVMREQQACINGLHQLSMEAQRLEQKLQYVKDRQKVLQLEMHGLSEALNQLNENQANKQESLQLQKSKLNQLQSSRTLSFNAKQEAEFSLNNARVSLQNAEKKAQEKLFNKKLLISNFNELENRVNFLNEEKSQLLNRLNETEALLEAAKMETLKSNLNTAITLKSERELALASARNQLTSIESDLQNLERTKMQIEQQLHPMRDRVENSKLDTQQARINFEQCQAGLADSHLDENELSRDLAAYVKPSQLEADITRLNNEIELLGPVNLAAIQELASERERKSYLDNQSQDLLEAVNTLEDAIRKIDKETRSRLQITFEEANRNFGELFTTLFGGGQAKLEMLGEEILDTGMQVFAQPPGKKNSTIHLLSGGEKAMTAIALVFALFRLNPAPFCLMDEVDAPLDDSNTERFCEMVKKMSERTQFLFVSHNKITMEMAQQLIGVTMQESGVSRIVEVDIEAAMQMHEVIS